MNQRIIKITQEIEKTKAKISELQILLPELEQKKIALENEEIIRRVRKASASARLGDLESVLEAIKQPGALVDSDIGRPDEDNSDEAVIQESVQHHQNTQEHGETDSKD